MTVIPGLVNHPLSGHSDTPLRPSAASCCSARHRANVHSFHGSDRRRNNIGRYPRSLSKASNLADVRFRGFFDILNT